MNETGEPEYIDAIEKCFINNKETLIVKHLADAAKNTVSISKSCKKDIENMDKYFKENNFKNASV